MTSLSKHKNGQAMSLFPFFQRFVCQPRNSNSLEQFGEESGTKASAGFKMANLFGLGHRDWITLDQKKDEKGSPSKTQRVSSAAPNTLSLFFPFLKIKKKGLTGASDQIRFEPRSTITRGLRE